MPAPPPPQTFQTPQTQSPPSRPDPRLRALIVQSMLLGGLLVALLIGAATLFFRRPEPAPVTLHPPPTATATATPSPLVVHVNGAVVSPGLYTLPAGARAGDALAAAGGLLPDADGERINQAERLFDGAQLYVPYLAPAGQSTPVADVEEPLAGLSGGVPTVEGRIVTIDLGQGPVNVNTASAAQLEALPNIGPQRAAEIIANRPYASLDDLDAVPGIGPATLEELRDLIVFD